MKIEDFDEILSRVTDAHPRKSYSRDQLLRLYKEIQELSSKQFEDAVIQLLDTEVYFPTIHKIRQACRPALDKIRGECKKFSNCAFCAGIGITSFEPMDTLDNWPTRYGVACPFCNASQQRMLPPEITRLTKSTFLAKDQFVHFSSANRRDPNYPRGKGRLAEKISYLTGDAEFAARIGAALAGHAKIKDKAPS